MSTAVRLSLLERLGAKDLTPRERFDASRVDFDPAKHPRAKNGKFAAKGASGAGQKFSSSVEASTDSTKAGDMKPVYDIDGNASTKKILSDEEIAVIAKGKTLTKGGAIEAYPEMTDDEYDAVEDQYLRKYAEKKNTEDDDENYLNAYLYKTFREEVAKESENSNQGRKKKGLFGRRKDSSIASLRLDFDPAKHPRAKNGKFAAKGAAGAGQKFSSALGRGRGMSEADLDAADAEMERQEQSLFTTKMPKVDKQGARAINRTVKDTERKTKTTLQDAAVQSLKRAAIGALIYVGAVTAISAGIVGYSVASQYAAHKRAKAANEKEWYDTLGVDKNSDYATVKKAYKDKARKMHPDINKDPEAEEQMKNINAAFDGIDGIFESKNKKNSRKDEIILDLQGQLFVVDFVEEKHPRAKDGKFAKKNSGGTLSPAVGSGRKSARLSRSKRPRTFKGTATKTAIAAGGTTAALMGVTALAVAYGVQEGKNAAADLSDFDFPDGGPIDFSRYDDLKPGTLLYKGFETKGIAKGTGLLHYAVYTGKDTKTGEHMCVHSSVDPKYPGTVSVISESIESQFASLSPERQKSSSHYKPVPASEMNPPETRFTTEEVVNRANALIDQPYRYGGVRDNCETIARVIVEGEARETQAQKVSPFGRKLVYAFTDNHLSKVRAKSGRQDNAKTALDMAEMLAERKANAASSSMAIEMARAKGGWELSIAAKAKAPPANPFRSSVYGQVFRDKGRVRGRADAASVDNAAADFIESLGMKQPDEFAQDIAAIAAETADESMRKLIKKQLWSAYFEVLLTSTHVIVNGKTGELRKDSAKAQLVESLRQDFTPDLHPRDQQGRFRAKTSGPDGNLRSAIATAERRAKSKRGRGGLALAVGVSGVAGVGAIAVVGGLGSLVKQSEEGTSDISHLQFPNPDAEYDFSRYDDFEPGSIIRKAFTAPGYPAGKGFLHYAIYKGKDPKTGEHLVIHAVPDPKDPKHAVAIVEQSIEDSMKRGGKIEKQWHSYFETIPESETRKGPKTPTKAEAVRRAESLIGQPYDYYSVRSNCESFARLIAEGTPYETQGPGVAQGKKDLVANLTKKIQDKARDESPIWKGKQPRTATEYAEILAKMESGQLSDSVKAEMQRNRQEWEAAPSQSVDAKTNRSIEQIFGWTLNELDKIEKKESRRADAENDFYALSGMKTPEQYMDLVESVVEGSTELLKKQARTYLWSNYLQMMVAILKGGKIKKDSKLEVIEELNSSFFFQGLDSVLTPRQRYLSLRRDRGFEPSLHPRDKNGRFALKAEGGRKLFSSPAMYSDVAQKMGISESDAKVFVLEHQTRVSEKLRHQHGLIVDHGLGSGKTITAINAAEEYGGAVVVGPASLRGNFEKELKKYGAEGQYEIYSYESFAKEQPSLKGRMLICDEAHRLRNSNTSRTKAVESAALESEKVLLLTATPIQNKPHDIATLVNIAAGKQVLPTSESGFNQQFLGRKTVKPNLFDRVFRKVPVYQVKEPKNMGKFKAKTSRYIDHYMPTKEGYPRVEEHSVQVEMSKAQVQQHRAWSNGAGANLRLKMERGIPLTKDEAGKMNVFINAQRQVANTDGSRESPKIAAISDRIKAVEDNRPSVVYSNYIGSGVEQMEKALDQRGLTHASFTGKLNDSDRKRIVEDYNGGKLNVLIISSSGGEGLDLKKTAQVHVMEPHWNAEKINQVTGRAIRYKSHDGLSPEEQRVEVYRYISTIPNSNGREKTADQYLAELSQQKGELVEGFTSTWRGRRRDILDLLTEDDWESSNHPRDKNGRFATKGGGTQLRKGIDPQKKQPGKSEGSGDTRTGESGKLIAAGESYTNQFMDDPEFAAAVVSISKARAKVAETGDVLSSQQGRVFGPRLAAVVDHHNASAELVNQFHALQPMAVKKMEVLQTQLKADSGMSKTQAKALVSKKNIVGDDDGSTAKDLTDYFQTIGVDLPTMKNVTITKTPGNRSHADPAESKSIVISNQQRNKPIVYHEASHHLEFNDPKLVKASADWIKKRSDGTGEHELRKFADPRYAPGEKAYKDFYIDPYCGVIYKENQKPVATEAISMGLQELSSPESMAKFYTLDPEHFNFTIGAIRPNGRTRKDSLTVRDALIEWLQGRYDFDPGLHARDERGRFSVKDGDRGMGVWYEGRRTAILVRAKNAAEAKEKAAKKKKQGGEVATVRRLTEQEEAIAAKGRWVRTGPKGEKPGELDIPGYGPRPKKLGKKDD